MYNLVALLKTPDLLLKSNIEFNELLVMNSLGAWSRDGDIMSAIQILEKCK